MEKKFKSSVSVNAEKINKTVLLFSGVDFVMFLKKTKQQTNSYVKDSKPSGFSVQKLNFAEKATKLIYWIF